MLPEAEHRIYSSRPDRIHRQHTGPAFARLGEFSAALARKGVIIVKMINKTTIKHSDLFIPTMLSFERILYAAIDPATPFI